jgi:DNA repair exonuclease SbcCD ATPase subunit/DNA repair exonuclease SbcCD nuclease subunit
MSAKFTAKTKLRSVKTIIHLADIHIRLFKRHQEYDQVFKTLYGLLDKRDLSESVIVVAGDIVHAKTDMSPEMVRVASEFLKSLADKTDTVIIAGNHDLNLANPHRLDALTPIVDNLGHERLHYFRESGIYDFADVQFAVHSVIGDQAGWPSPSEMDSRPKIALYHAPVNKAQTDVGYSVTSKVTVETFNGYDMVMLGDIHKMQILQQKAPGLPEIAYAGSLIQQNHGESLDNHGFFVWDVAKSSIAEYVEVPNDYGYCTITIDSKTMPSTAHLPKNARLRVFVGDVDASFVKKAIATIRKKHGVVELSVNKLVKKTTGTSNVQKSAIDNIHDVTHQNTLVKKYIEEHYPNIATDVIQKVLDVNTKTNTLIGDEELPKNISWRPLSIKFDNLFSYGEGNEVNFDGMNGLYGVFSPNATGKTSAFDAMCFALYDKTPRAFKGSHIMNTRRNTFSCTLEFEIENKQYVIERTGTRKKNGEVKVDVNFYRKEADDKITSLNGEDRRDTNANIRSYVGTYEDFVLTTLSVQNQNSLFIDTGQSDRKDLLSQFIGLTIFDRLFNLASDEIKEVAGALKTFKKDDFTQKLADLQKGIDTHEDICKRVTSSIEQLKTEIDEATNDIETLASQKLPIDPALTKINNGEQIAVEIKIAQQRFSTMTGKITRTNDSIRFRTTELTQLQEDLSRLPDIRNIEDVVEKRSKSEKTLIALDGKRKTLLVDIKNKQEKLEKLKEHKYDPNCEFCINNVFVKDAEETAELLEQLQTEFHEVTRNIDNGNLFLERTKTTADEYNQILKFNKQIDDVQRALATVQIEREQLRTEMATYDKELNEKMDLHKKYVANNASIQKNLTIQEAINEQTNNRAAYQRELKQAEISYQKIYAELAVLKRQRDDLKARIKEAEELEDTYEAYETYLSVIGRDGLPYHLMSTVIPELQTQVNNILSQMVDFTVALEVDGKNINGKIIYDDDRTWPLELASGMEKFISGLAIRVALMSVSNLPKANFLVIDEGLGVLDSENLSSMFMMFNVLKTQFDFIILISHLDVVRDIADSLIEIKREDGFSYINVE